MTSKQQNSMAGPLVESTTREMDEAPKQFIQPFERQTTRGNGPGFEAARNP